MPKRKCLENLIVFQAFFFVLSIKYLDKITNKLFFWFRNIISKTNDNQLFQQFEYKEFPMPAPANNFFVPDRSFELANFPRFDEMAMFFKQFSTPFKLKPKKGTY